MVENKLVSNLDSVGLESYDDNVFLHLYSYLLLRMEMISLKLK